MIETSLVRVKAVEAAIKGDLTREYICSVSAKDELSSLMEREINNAPTQMYEVRDSWMWVELSEIVANVTYPFADGPFGSNLKREHYTRDKQVRIIQLSNIGELGWKDENEKYTTYEHLETIKRSEVEVGNIVIAKMMPAGRAVIVPAGSSKYVLSSDCVKYVPFEKLNTRYICYAINSPMFRKQVIGGVHGIGRERTSLSKLKKYVIPLPTIEEQNLIVERLDKVFALLDRIDLLQEGYAADYDALKNKIIDAGIRGELTEQLPEDGTAEELYQQIQFEKAELIKEKKIKKTKLLPEITADEIPFDIPQNWKWVHLDDLAQKICSGNTPAGGKKSNAYVEEGHCFFREQNIYDDGIHEEGMVYITEELLNSRENSTVIAKDILLNITGGSIGRCALIDDDFDRGSINQHILIIRMVDERLRFYIHRLLCSPYAQKYIKFKSVGDKDGFSGGRCKLMPIPLPPLAEQERIAKKIDDLLAAMPE